MSQKKALFIGRFQPFHLGHEYLFNHKLSKGIPILIAIRDVKPDENNPLTAEQSKALIEARYTFTEFHDRVEVIIIPDIESVNWGRGVGYETNEITVPESIGTISATRIRKMIADKNDSWKKYIHPSIHVDIIKLLGNG